jgi:hypothetical protein
MQRLLLILLAVTLLLALTPTPAYAGPLLSDGGEGTFDTVASVIGTLGLYAAMMAVLAVGAEIVIDIAKPVLGLKRNKTAGEALDELKQWMPAAIEDLGLAPDAREKLNDSIEELKSVTDRFASRTERAHTIVQEQLPDILKDLAVYSVKEVLNAHWPEIEAQLEEIEAAIHAEGATDDALDRLEDVLEEHEPDLAQELHRLRGEVDTGAALNAVQAWLTKTLNRLKGTSVAEIEAQVENFNHILQAIEEQRHKLEGPARKLWRWLRDAPWSRGWLGWLLIRLEYGWTWLRGKLPEGEFSEQLAYLRAPYKLPAVKNLQEAFSRLLEVDGQYQIREQRRITWLRVISAVVGVGLAATLRVDSLQLLKPLLGDAADIFSSQAAQWYTFADLIEQGLGSDPTLALPGILERAAATLLSLTPGTVLSGLGAAAGSSFWHDQLARLRSFKETARQGEEIVQQLGG